MENFNEYWELFVDKKDSIAKEIIAYYKTLDDREDGTELSEQCCAFFGQNILVNPYPTCQLLKLLAISKIPGKNNVIYEIATAAALQAFGDDQYADDASKCYSILANCLISVKAVSALKSRIMHALERKKVDLDWLVLAVLSRKSNKLLVNLLPDLSIALKQQWACDALDMKRHFLNSLLDSKQTYVHHTNYMRFMQQVILANSDNGAFSPTVLSVRPLYDQSKGRSYLTAYLLELQRCHLLQDALHIDGALLPAYDFSQHAIVTGMLARAKVNLVDYDFATLFALMSTNQTMLEQIAVSLGNETTVGHSETMELIQIQVLMVLFKAMEASFAPEENESAAGSYIDAQLKCLMKETDVQTFVQVAESIVTMLFARSELFSADGVATTERKYFLCSLPLLGAVATSVKAIMITRKHSAAYVDASEPLKRRFQTILDHIIDVCWRLSLFDYAPLGQENANAASSQLETTSSKRRAVQLTDLLSVPTAPSTESNWESSKSSSVDRCSLFRSFESINVTDIGQRHRLGMYGTLPRQKPSRRHTRHPPAATGSSNSGGSNKDLRRQTSLSMDAKSESIPYAAEGEGHGGTGGKKAFTKLFASPETLAIVCLTSDKMNSAKQIIDSHNLHELPVGRIVQRIEQMQSLKNNLASLVRKHERKQEAHVGYGAQGSDSSSSDTLLDDIRLKTAVGFEISKVLSTVETFLKSTPTDEESTSTKDGGSVLPPMDRFIGRYPFLGVHTGKNLHLSQIVDTVLSLPFKYELNLAIYNFLLKNAKPYAAAPPTSVMSTSMTGAGGGAAAPDMPHALLVGNFVTFFGSLIDTLQIAQRTGRAASDPGLTIGHLLARELCPLDAVKNGVVLKRRARFYSMLERSNERAASIERSLALLAGCGSPSLGRTRQLLAHLVELVGVLPSAATATDERTVDELIRLDPEAMLVQALFERKLPLPALDALAAKLGVQLVQTIGKRLLSSDDTMDATSVNGLWEFIASKSDLLLRLCQAQRGELPPDGNEQKSQSQSLIVQYKNLRNATSSEGSLLPRIRCYRAPRDGPEPRSVQSQRLFPLGAIRTCCPLTAQSGASSSDGGDPPLWSCDVEGRSMEQNASELLANVDRFAKATEWISASEHLLTGHSGAGRRDGAPLSAPMRRRLQEKANQLGTYLQIGSLLRAQLPDPSVPGDDGWRSVRRFSESNQSVILQQLIEQGEYRVCAEWIKLHPIEAERELEMFVYAVHRVTAASPTPQAPLERGSDTPAGLLFAIIETMPVGAVVKLYETMMLNIRNVPAVSYMLEYLQRHGTRKPLYQKYAISLRIFEHLARDEYDGLWNLASRPLLIVEQCLMNSRLELLAGVMRSVRPLLVEELCRPCFEHREYIRDLHDAVTTATTPSRRDPVHEGLFIGHECVDCLFRVYAGKALEYKVFPEAPLQEEENESSGGCRLSRVSSYDSLSEVARPFVMPREIPPRDRWVKDEDALHCMCCRRTFSMLNRRHHCRRCGRVVCHSCSKRKERLRDFYEDAAVRVCDDCWAHLLTSEPAAGDEGGAVESAAGDRPASGQSGQGSQFEWQLTGNERYDNVIRDEYSYEYAPSTGQCLAICSLHTANEEIGAFLLYHCAKLEALLRPLHPGFPNPEVDYALVARMLLNLTLGVKVRGGGAEVEKMKEHAEIILSIVHDNCESLLLHTVPIGNHHGSLRRLRDELVRAEKWTLALELSLKCGFSLNGVMAAWGMTCLRAGCYDTAREKFSHCLPRVASEQECDAVLRMVEEPPGGPTITKLAAASPIVKRPARCPPLLNEILYALSCTARLEAPSQRVMARVRAARQQSSSATHGSSNVGPTGGPMHEPALNILSTLANLRHVCQGEFGEVDSGGALPPLTGERPVARSGSLLDSRLFEESMHYLLAYGSHHSVVVFLMRHRQTELAALRYILCQRVDPDVFLHAVLLPHLQRGALDTIVQRLTDLDETLLEWRDYIRYACRYLETNDMLNSLYSLQLLLKDPIRASMTCVRFYIAGCRSFTELHASEHHLKTSITHLQNELELCNWQEVRLNSTGSVVETHRSLLMKLDPKELNNHINTILLQLEVTKFLAKCEAKGRQTVAVLPKIFRETTQLPTLFGSSQEKLQLAILTLVCGQNVEEAFGLSYRIIQDYNLDVQRVYALTAKYFINHTKIEDVGKLLDAIMDNNGVRTATAEPALASVCDEIVRVSVDVAIARHGAGVDTKVALEALVGRASSVAVRIHCYVVSGQLKTAYLLANRHHRIGDIRKILRQAELLGQTHVKRLCEVRLNHQDDSGSAGGSIGGEDGAPSATDK